MKTKDQLNKKKNRKRTIIITLTIIVVLILGVIYLYNNMTNYEKLNFKDLGINENNNDQNKINKSKFVNIAIFGVDSRANTWTGLSDTIIVATLDYENKQIKLSSFMRDSLVYIEGHGYEKQTHAYSYGNAQLAVKTLNTNYDLDIQEYVTINFNGLEKVVNKLGGVKIEIKSYEISEINKIINNLNSLNGNKVELITQSGEQLLNGRQTVAYARIRKVGNGDEQRTQRQREVIEKIINKIQNLNYQEALSLANEFMPYVKTSFSLSDSLNKAKDFNFFKTATVLEFKYPDTYKFATVNKSSVVKPDTLETNVIKLHQFIYNIEQYMVSDKVIELSTEINKK